jgi:hypothetical protein
MTRVEHHSGEWKWASWDRRDLIVTLASAAAAALALVPVAMIAITAPAGNYASRYGSVAFTFDNMKSRLEGVVLPSRGGLPKLSLLLNDPGWRSWLAFPSLLWLAVLVLGIVALVAGRSNRKRGARWPMLFAAVWIILGVIAYVPWPSQAMFYMLPFAFGLTVLLGCLLSLVARPAALAMTVGTSVVVAISAIEARDIVHEHRLRVKTDMEIISAIARDGKSLPLYAAVPFPAGEGTYGWGLKLAEFGRAAGLIDPSRAGDIGCVEARQRAAMRQPIIIVSAREGCGPIKNATIVVSETEPRRRWPWIMRSRINNRVAFVTRAGEDLVSSSEDEK